MCATGKPWSKLVLKHTVLLFLDWTLEISTTNSNSVITDEAPAMCQSWSFADVRTPPLSMRRKRRRPPLPGPVPCLMLPSCSQLSVRYGIRPHRRLPNSLLSQSLDWTPVWWTPKQDLFTAWDDPVTRGNSQGSNPDASAACCRRWRRSYARDDKRSHLSSRMFL